MIFNQEFVFSFPLLFLKNIYIEVWSKYSSTLKVLVLDDRVSVVLAKDEFKITVDANEGDLFLFE